MRSSLHQLHDLLGNGVSHPGCLGQVEHYGTLRLLQLLHGVVLVDHVLANCRIWNTKGGMDCAGSFTKLEQSSSKTSTCWSMESFSS